MPIITAVRFGALALVSVAMSVPTEGAQSVSQVATLRTARSVHTSTTLPNGQVLIVGGMATGGRSVDAVELFDPARNTVATLDPLGEPRASHTATLLNDGRVLIAGGYDGEYLASVVIYDPARRRFSPAGPLTEARSGHTATLLPDGRVLIIGGVGRGWTFLRSAEIYDPATGRSVAVGDMAVPRESHAVALLADSTVLVVGGHTGRRSAMEVYRSIERFSPRTQKFEVAGALEIARHKHDAVRLDDGRVLIVGGADRSDRVYFATTEIFDPRTGVTRAGPKMADARYKIAGTSVLLPNGNVLVTSGASQAEVFDPRLMTFRRVPGQIQRAYHFAAASLLPGGDVIISGGYANDNRATPGVWRYKP